MFDSTVTNAGMDIATMAKHRAATAAASTMAGSNVYMSFDGLAELLRGSVPLAPPLAAPLAAAPPPRNPENDITKWPKMDLTTFCDQFEVPNQLQDKTSRSLYPRSSCSLLDQRQGPSLRRQPCPWQAWYSP